MWRAVSCVLALFCLFVVACSPQVTLPEPAPGPPTASTPQPNGPVLAVSDGVVTDSSEMADVSCMRVWLWSVTTGGAGWRPVALGSVLVDTSWHIADGSEIFCGGGQPLGPDAGVPSFELPGGLPEGWYTACNIDMCTEPFELD